MRILIVEDDEEIGPALAAALERRGATVALAPTAATAETALAAAPYDAMIIDLGLPDCDGQALLLGLREGGDMTPAIILSARSAITERIAGLNNGADDYVVKPFDVDELHARLIALLRRRSGAASPVATIENLTFDRAAQEGLVGGASIGLTAREAELLALLLERPGRSVPKRKLVERLGGAEDELGANAVDVYMHRLRRRLKRHGARVEIQTVRGVGYILRSAR